MIPAENIIVAAEYGSRSVGVASEDSDHDIMAVFVEPPQFVTGIESTGTHASSTAEKSERSTREDTDITEYPLRKWATLAAKGNPTVLALLFNEQELISTSAWNRILDIRGAFLSREAGRRFRGYSWGQREAMTGHRNKRTNRPELVHKHGYDTKFAYHMVRTAMQGIELMNTGALTLPMRAGEVGLLRSIRTGTVTKDSVLALAAELDRELASAIESSWLPDQPNRDAISRTLHNTYLNNWGRA